MVEQPFVGSSARVEPAIVGSPYLDWSAIVAGALLAAALSFVLISFGSALGLAVASPSATWRDTSIALAIVGGLWLLLTAVVSFGLGGYVAGRLRMSWRNAATDEVEFRDGVHGVIVWGLAVILAGALALATVKPSTGSADLARPQASTAEPLLALELDRLLRSDRTPVDPANDPELRGQAARIITTGLGHSGMAADDRAYLIRLVQTRTGLAPADAESRVNQAIAQADEAISRARRSAVILGFMIAASLILGLAVAWMAAAGGGQHRDNAVAHYFWRRWEVDRFFVIR
jgi:hypothetical protein